MGDIFMAEKFYKKEFIVENDMYIKLSNAEPVIKYIEEMLEKLLTVSSFGEAAIIKSEIFQNFKEIYEYDLLNAKFPVPFGHFENIREKEDFITKKILIQDIGFYLSDLFRNYHQNHYLKTKTIPKVIIPKMMIGYSEIYYKSVCDYYSLILGMDYPFEITEEGIRYKRNIEKSEFYVSDKNIENGEHAITATFVLPSLIEHFLIDKLQKRMLYSGIKEVNILVKENKIILEEIDDKIIKKFESLKNGIEKVTFLGSEKYITERMYSLFVKSKILKNTKDNKMILVGEKRTLGAILYSDYAKSQIKEEYMYVLDSLFSAKKMNLRNSIMHGNNTTYNYLNVGITSVMFEIFWAIARGDIFI